MTFETINPATGTPGPRWNGMSAADVARTLDRCHTAYLDWSRRGLGDRAAVVERAADLLEEHGMRYASLMASEMGKPVTQGQAEAEKCAWVCRHYARNAEEWLRTERVSTEASYSGVRCDPLGVVLAIMPWNFPFWQVFRFGAPALMAGNGFLLKHAPNTFGCGVAIEALFREAGLPEGLLANLVVDTDAVPTLLADPRVVAVTLTGSERAGSAVAAEAGRNLKKSVMELGGSDPFIVLADADLDRAAEVGASARLLNAGQSCIAAKRFIVEAPVADAFVDKFAARLAAARVGDPHDPATTVGPIARADLRDNLHRQVLDSVARGASIRLGGVLPDGPGCFYPPTLLTDVQPGMPAWDEELFGPVAALRVVEDVDAALVAANDTVYGLGASLWTRDLSRARRLVPELQAGCVFVNEMVKSDPRVPFGGVKKSGYGRELGRIGLLEFVNRKTVWFA